MSRSLIVALLFVALEPTSIVFAQDAAETQPVRNDSWRYDAVGRLLRNSQSKDKKSPPYVLVDKTGKPRCYITPDNGVNVANLVNRRVGVRGSVKTIEGDPLPHIVARGVRQVGDPAASGAKPSDVVAAGHVERVAGQEELPAPMSRSRQTVSGSPEAIEGGTIVEGNAMQGPQAGPENYDTSGSFVPGDGSCDGGQCGHDCCPARPCGCCIQCCMANDPGLWWVRAEYLAWTTKGMYIPPLVTTGPDAENPGFLGVEGTQILFGDQTINNDVRNGGRISFGRWLDCCQTWGLGGEYFALEDEGTNFFAESDENGSPFISRPYFAVVSIDDNGTPDPDDDEIAPAAQAVEEVAFEDELRGSVEVNTNTSFQGAGAYLRYNICCKNMCWPQCCCCDPCNNCGTPGGLRVGILGGFRFYKLRDSVSITENLESLDEENPGNFFVHDSFSTRNQFNGAEVGFVLDARKARWTAELMGRIAVGGNRQTVTIDGVTVNSNSDNDGTFEGGLLALPTNIGTYNRSTFAVIPQLNANLGYNLTPRLRVMAGYTLIYWSSVARAGEQISLDVNETFIPNSSLPEQGVERPAFVWRNSDFWAQGVNIGVDYRF